MRKFKSEQKFILDYLKSIRGFLSLDGVDGHISGNTNPNERASER